MLKKIIFQNVDLKDYQKYKCKVLSNKQKKDKTQNEIAEMLGLHKTQYQRYENAEKNQFFEVLISLADYYNVSLDYIAGRTNDKKGLTRSELSAEETELIKKFRSLSEMRKGKLSERLEMLYEDEREETALRKEAK